MHRRPVVLFSAATLLFSLLLLSLLLSLVDDVVSPCAALTTHDHMVEKRLHASQEITIDTIKDMEEKELREHLTWRGDVCHDCDTKEKLHSVLHDHVMAGTPASTRKYYDASGQLRSGRKRVGVGDHAHGHDRERMRAARARRHADPKDPLTKLHHVLRSHGLEMKSVAGQKDTHDYLEKKKRRSKGEPLEEDL
jgi:hypothetical protein